jgi:CheY-like chemotaxis protein
LDIGLPTLNGIEAARRIREVAPTSKILFVSENRSPEIAAAALSTGAGGYVVKSDAASELLPAVEGVLQGTQFVSASLNCRDLSNLRNERTADHLCGKEFTASLREQNVEADHHHRIAFYPDDAALVDGFARFIEASLKIGHAAVVITTETHRATILRRLRADGLDLAVEREHFVLLDVADSLPPFMVDVSGDQIRFAKGARYRLVEAVKAATEKHLHVAVG